MLEIEEEQNVVVDDEEEFNPIISEVRSLAAEPENLESGSKMWEHKLLNEYDMLDELCEVMSPTQNSKSEDKDLDYTIPEAMEWMNTSPSEKVFTHDVDIFQTKKWGESNVAIPLSESEFTPEDDAFLRSLSGETSTSYCPTPVLTTVGVSTYQNLLPMATVSCQNSKVSTPLPVSTIEVGSSSGGWSGWQDFGTPTNAPPVQAFSTLPGGATVYTRPVTIAPRVHNREIKVHRNLRPSAAQGGPNVSQKSKVENAEEETGKKVQSLKKQTKSTNLVLNTTYIQTKDQEFMGGCPEPRLAKLQVPRGSTGPVGRPSCSQQVGDVPQVIEEVPGNKTREVVKRVEEVEKAEPSPKWARFVPEIPITAVRKAKIYNKNKDRVYPTVIESFHTNEEGHFLVMKAHNSFYYHTSLVDEVEDGKKKVEESSKVAERFNLNIGSDTLKVSSANDVPMSFLHANDACYGKTGFTELPTERWGKTRAIPEVITVGRALELKLRTEGRLKREGSLKG